MKYFFQFYKIKFFFVYNFLCSLMQVEGDLDGLEQVFGRNILLKKFGLGLCFVFVKLLFGNKDLLILYDMWGFYNSMLWLFKFYNLFFYFQLGVGVNFNNI